MFRRHASKDFVVIVCDGSAKMLPSKPKLAYRDYGVFLYDLGNSVREQTKSPQRCERQSVPETEHGLIGSKNHLLFCVQEIWYPHPIENGMWILQHLGHPAVFI
jgi:hypothetical protein